MLITSRENQINFIDSDAKDQIDQYAALYLTKVYGENYKKCTPFIENKVQELCQNLFNKLSYKIETSTELKCTFIITTAPCRLDRKGIELVTPIFAKALDLIKVNYQQNTPCGNPNFLISSFILVNNLDKNINNLPQTATCKLQCFWLPDNPYLGDSIQSYRKDPVQHQPKVHLIPLHTQSQYTNNQVSLLKFHYLHMHNKTEDIKIPVKNVQVNHQLEEKDKPSSS